MFAAQFSCLGVRQSIVNNFDVAEASEQLSGLLALAWSSVQLRSAAASLNVQFSKKVR